MEIIGFMSKYTTADLCFHFFFMGVDKMTILVLRSGLWIVSFSFECRHPADWHAA